MSVNDEHLAREPRSLPPLGNPTTQSDLVSSYLREAILSGQFELDQLLVERRLAEQLGVSKTPVREALIQLSNSGLVTVTRNRGVRVRRLSRSDARHVYEQRILLEPWAASAAARSDGADFATAQRCFAQAATQLELADWPAVALANRQFHRALYVQCPNPLVVATLDTMQDLTALATLHVFWEISPTAGSEHEEHREILRAAEAGDAAATEELMRSHISRSLDRIGALGPTDQA